MSETASIKEQIESAEKEFEAARLRLLQLRRQIDPVDVSETVFLDVNGQSVPIADLFGDNEELLLIHNMGSGCAYCTLWADGFNGSLPYLASRSAFAVLSKDGPAKMKNFAESRGWTFQMVSGEGSTFAEDLGVASKDMYWPGVSALKRESDGKVVRTSWADFGPGDLYCPAWHLFDLLPNGAADWEPNYNR